MPATASLAKRYRAPAHGFARKFSPLDVALLAETDALHATLSGPATVHLLQRAHALYGDPRYQRLAGLSVSHLYNLRAQAGYQAKRGVWTKTKGRSVAIGQRRAPAPQGRAGFIRIDSVHQGDFDGLKGVYHINAVDCLTQFELVATCERISEAYLLPALESLLEDFPFTVLGFHADNGSEYINHTVAKLLDKLRVEFTKSRPRVSNDNALAETKNAAIVRKHLGYAHVPQRCASEVNAFCRQFLNPYVNFHRPCFFPHTTTDSKGRIRKRYRFEDMMTPYEKLKSLPNAAGLPQTGHELRGAGCLRGSHQRQPGRTAHERSQRKAVSIHPTSIQAGGLTSPAHYSQPPGPVDLWTVRLRAPGRLPGKRRRVSPRATLCPQAPQARHQF